MKTFTVIFASLLSTCVWASSVEVSQNPFPLIPATAVSCLAMKAAGGSAPITDISASYFRIPAIKFINSSQNDINISFIRIQIPIKGSSTSVSCEYGGNALSALFSMPLKDIPKIPANSEYSSTCPLYCGGIATNEPGISTGTMEVFGFTEDKDHNNQTPENLTTTLSIQSF